MEQQVKRPMETTFTKNWQALKKLIVYNPTEVPSHFVLEENNEREETEQAIWLTVTAQQHVAQLRYAHRVLAVLKKAKKFTSEPLQPECLQTLKLELEALEEQKSQLSPIIQTYNLETSPLDQSVSTSLDENKLVLERLYNLPANKDLVIRDINLPSSPPVKAMIVFVEGLVDKKIINLSVLSPLLLGSADRQLCADKHVINFAKGLLPSSQVKASSILRDVSENLNMGDTAIFFEGADEAVIIETKGQEHRSIDRPAMEQTILGSQAAFTEMMRVNTGLVRSMLRTSDLTTEIFDIGIRSNTKCALMYLKSLINPLLVKEAKRRLTSLKVDSVLDAGQLKLLIIDHPYNPYPQLLTTERPDRVAAALLEGRFAVVLDGSPLVIVGPISLFTLFHSGEDFSFSWIFASFSRILRLFGGFFTVLLPALYIAINYFHQEALPTDLLLAIGSSRERVPFPAVAEIWMMEFAFELLREAGIRVPGLLGSTIGIVGAIILGQAGVAAGIVSPITVVVVAVTGLASFAIPDFALSYAIRLTRFAFELLAAIFGLVGIACGLLAVTVILCATKSFGIPYLVPVAPKVITGYDVVLRGPVYSQELRPDELSPRDRRRQATVSQKWPQVDSQEEDRK